MEHNNNSAECPCKYIPQASLSTFTAAEYGDLHTFIRKSSRATGIDAGKTRTDTENPPIVHTANINRGTVGGYTPLHFAAQNDHADVTSYLLRAGADVNGGYRSRDDVTSTSGGTAPAVPSAKCTPLHRAAFSGALSAMRILLRKGATPDDGLFLKDYSFGDGMTALHKSSAGGRYLAVYLLLETLRERGNGRDGSSLLARALLEIDSSGRTALDIANDTILGGEEERRSVSRWDGVAGYRADWVKCGELLRRAGGDGTPKGRASSVKDDPPSRNTEETTNIKRGGIVTRHDDPLSACQCSTASWRGAFQRAIENSAEAELRTGRESGERRPPSHRKINTALKSVSIPPADSSRTGVLSTKKSDTNLKLGQSCHACKKHCIALCRGKDGILICRKCLSLSKIGSVR